MKAVIWSKPNCPYCEQAKQLLTRKGVQTEIRVLGEGRWTKELLLRHVPNAKTVPQIFLNEEYVGGLNELRSKIGA
jgi:glutaredoxin 3